jgi:AP-3 complex subunit beta
MRMDTLLPDWLENGVESSLRDTEETAPALAPQPILAVQRNKGIASPVVLTPSGGSSPVGSQTRSGGSKGPWMDLDKFYADEEEVEEEDGDNDDGEEDEDDEDEDEDEDEESEEEDKEHSDDGEEPKGSEDHHSEEENHTEIRAFTAGTHLEFS